MRAHQDAHIETIERQTYDGALRQPFTAHPKIDPVTGENMCMHSGEAINVTGDICCHLQFLAHTLEQSLPVEEILTGTHRHSCWLHPDGTILGFVVVRRYPAWFWLSSVGEAPSALLRDWAGGGRDV